MRKFIVNKNTHPDTYISDVLNGKTIYDVKCERGELQINFTDRTHMKIDPSNVFSLIVMV